ncbi:hypothetical protein [Streptomyces spectabilis]|uniref:Uncharacterized protein n=1 Tax=Streptomyces spectabilis TaxID=68270 RepID=A0A7W8B363_STRST|nr:hypothetical protein [Streptomyces spectabilis]MBB5109473.1 hypothetical protein [Streptomyces spectabilis]MCI3907820.1 hypothetical protein [Streptomyces spectabilis]GGV53405.1 hypothetical protein GCM10010245_84260 [Streptomyces spectabilis]
MTHNFGLYLTLELGDYYGSPSDSWPAGSWSASTEHVIPFFTIVVNELGADRAAHWFIAAEKAHKHVAAADQARDHQFGFAAHLNTEIGDDREPSLPCAAAWEAMKALYELVRRDAAADPSVLFNCAVLASGRKSGRTDQRLVAAPASA